jgi:hypothetical protein
MVWRRSVLALVRSRWLSSLVRGQANFASSLVGVRRGFRGVGIAWRWVFERVDGTVFLQKCLTRVMSLPDRYNMYTG